MMYLHENAINLYNRIARYYATHADMPRMQDMEIDPRVWHKALVLLQAWGWITFLRPGVMVLNRPTERGLTPGELAAMFYQYGVKPL